MKFECSAQDLFYGLQNATRALSSRPAMQILEGVLLSCDEDGVLLQCSDGSLSIKTQVAATVAEPGQVILPGRPQAARRHRHLYHERKNGRDHPLRSEPFHHHRRSHR